MPSRIHLEPIAGISIAPTRWLRRIRPHFGILITLLQRAPALRVAAGAGERALPQIAAIARSLATTASVLGAIHALAGASANLVSSSGTAAGITVAANSLVEIGYTVNGTATLPMSWTIGGSIPPGLNFSNGLATPGLTSPGIVDTETPSGALLLSGTPTAAGAYDLTIQAWEGPDGTEIGSPIYAYTIVVTASLGGSPGFSTQPQDQTVVVGGTATFAAAATGSPTYQWQFNGSNIPGATAASLTLTNVQPSGAGIYSVVATNAGGMTDSDNATLTVNNAPGGPVFTSQPVQQTIASGSTVVFAASASGQPAPTYQWFLNGSAISGATGATLLVGGATAAAAGLYNCVATNSGGITSSNQANLTVVFTSDVGRLINLACRAPVGTGGNILIAGFVVGGSGTGGSTPLLVRATGPTLGTLSVQGWLPDPKLQLFNSASVPLASDTGWETDANAPLIPGVASLVGAFAWPQGSADSALYLTEPPGAYSAQITGAGGDTGVALAEVYDATPPGTFTATTPRLVNLSARAQVGTGGSILIAGFVVGGTTAKTVLIRASGPALGAVGVAGTLPDPQLKVFDGAGNQLASNAGWGGDPQIAGVARSVGAFPWSAGPSLDSALVTTLPPGGYTAQISGVSGDGGLVLTEVYDVP